MYAKTHQLIVLGRSGLFGVALAKAELSGPIGRETTLRPCLPAGSPTLYNLVVAL